MFQRFYIFCYLFISTDVLSYYSSAYCFVSINIFQITTLGLILTSMSQLLPKVKHSASECENFEDLQTKIDECEKELGILKGKYVLNRPSLFKNNFTDIKHAFSQTLKLSRCMNKRLYLS